MNSTEASVNKLQWGPALKAGRNVSMSAWAGFFAPASMGPGPKGREEHGLVNQRPLGSSQLQWARP